MPEKTERTLEEAVQEAVSGSREALEEVVCRIQDRLFRLSLRMLFRPADAEDATQEILIKIVTHLDSFRQEGPFRAWAYRIAVNHLKSIRKNFFEHRELGSDKAQGLIDWAQAKGWFNNPLEAPYPLLELEMRSACTQALLVTMDRNHRIAFILGVVLEVSGQEGGDIMGISPETFRKRLSRSRHRVKDFLSANCGLFDQTNHCHCNKLLAGHVEAGWINPDRPVFVSKDENNDDPRVLREYMKELDALGKVSALFKSFPEKDSSKDYSALVKSLVDEGRFRIFSEFGSN